MARLAARYQVYYAGPGTDLHLIGHDDWLLIATTPDDPGPGWYQPSCGPSTQIPETTEVATGQRYIGLSPACQPGVGRARVVPVRGILAG